MRLEQENTRLRKALEWAAQTIHQAYHHGPISDGRDLDALTWRDCPKDICASIRHELSEDAQ